MKADFEAITKIKAEIEKQNKIPKAPICGFRSKKSHKINGKGEIRDMGKLNRESPN